MKRWSGAGLQVAAYRAELQNHQVDKILRDTHSHIAPALALGERVFREFIELFAWRPKLRLASR